MDSEADPGAEAPMDEVSGADDDAPADALHDESEQDESGHDEAEPSRWSAPRRAPSSGGARTGLSTLQIAVLVVAFAFLGGAMGYLLGHRTSGPPDSAVDTGFLQDMIDHHEQAVSMASVATAGASDPLVRDMAREVLIEQRYEIGLMDGYLQARDEERGAPERQVMAWMGRPVPLADMPGLATPEQMDALQAADPDATNLLFLELMKAHHLGGIDMAEYAARHAADPRVRHLAEVMARVQRQEVREYELKIAELNGG